MLSLQILSISATIGWGFVFYRYGRNYWHHALVALTWAVVEIALIWSIFASFGHHYGAQFLMAAISLVLLLIWMIICSEILALVEREKIPRNVWGKIIFYGAKILVTALFIWGGLQISHALGV